MSRTPSYAEARRIQRCDLWYGLGLTSVHRFLTPRMELVTVVRATTIFALVLLGGCAIRIPEGTPTAMLRFTADGYMSQITVLCPEDRTRVKGGMVNNEFWNEVSPVKMYGTREDKNNKVMERLIPAGRQIGFRFLTARSSAVKTTEYYDCSLAFAFTPAAGEQYQADYQWAQESGRCTVKLSRLAVDGGMVRKLDVPVRVFRSRSPDDNSKAIDAVCAN